MIKTSFLVLNDDGKPVEGLNLEDFFVTEEAKLQEIVSFSQSNNRKQARSIVLVLDGSRSNVPLAEIGIESANVLIDLLPPEDKLAIVTDDVQLLADFTTNRKSLKKAVKLFENRINSGLSSKSLQMTALLAVLNKLFSSKHDPNIVILQSDGDECNAFAEDRVSEPISADLRKFTGFYDPNKLRDFGMLDIKNAIRKYNVKVYSVYPFYRFLGVPEVQQLELSYKAREEFLKFDRRLSKQQRQMLAEKEKFLNRDFHLIGETCMTKIANFSGGFLRYLEKPEDARAIYSTILAAEKYGYSLSFYADDSDAEKRKFEIAVRNHPEYKVVLLNNSSN
ncbi:MAG: hypothetical protein ACK5NT_07020 [Pyrinomonadaceae bacterium]